MEKVFARDWFSSRLSVCSSPHLAKPFSDVRNPAQSQPRAWAFVHRDGGFPKRCTRPAGLRTSDGFAKGKTLRKAAVPLAAIKTEFALYNPHSFEIQFIKSFQSHKIENLK